MLYTQGTFFHEGKPKEQHLLKAEERMTWGQHGFIQIEK